MTIKIQKFMEQFNKEYRFLYDNYDRVAGYREAVDEFDHLMKTNDSFNLFVINFCEYRGDFISSDREAAAFMFALDVLA